MANRNKLLSLYYHVTNRCNLRCRHCWVRAGSDAQNEELSLEEAIDIVRQCRELGLTTVKLTGGEPFVVSWLMDFIAHLDGVGINVTIETNGTLISQDIADRLVRHRKIVQVAVSLDGKDANSHEYLRRVPGSFDRVMDGIRRLTSVGIHPHVMVAVHKRNAEQLQDIGVILSRYGVRSIKLNCIQGDGRGEDMVRCRETLGPEEQLKLFENLEEFERHTGVCYQLAIPLTLRPFRKLKRHVCGACNVQNTLGLLPNGDFALCGIGLTVPDLRFGNARDYSVATIWHETPLIQRIADGLPDALEGVCRECSFKTVCRGGCRARAFEATGNIMSPQPLCQWARKNGRIPEARLLSGVSSVAG